MLILASIKQARGVEAQTTATGRSETVAYQPEAAGELDLPTSNFRLLAHGHPPAKHWQRCAAADVQPNAFRVERHLFHSNPAANIELFFYNRIFP